MKDIRIGGNTSQRRRTNTGSVFVETAFIFTVFAGMLFGAFDLGQVLFIHQALVERARSAARWGAINDPTDSASITNMVLYNQATAPPTATAAYLNLNAANISVTTPDPGTDSYRLNLQVSGYHYKMFSPFLAGNYTGARITVSVPLGLYN